MSNSQSSNVPKNERRKVNDPGSPYFLHSFDIPGLNICGITLRGKENYREWSIVMRNAFRAKWKLGFLDGSITISEDKSGIEDWYTVNSMAVGWLMTSIEPTLRHTIAYMDSVHELWKEKICT
ncbi:unnamed protein product [Cuscuta europaea]|uniref:Retrotransposon Copia-like N-terminal domain-containing protein n=1 Tax=Cuscuta europaea TaxID=41803 RepID=A0A9P0ZCA9_CUSEU|nr:unnamed protein product [Cuscuta europaea]